MRAPIASALMFLWFATPLLAFLANLRRQQRRHALLLYAITIAVGFPLAVGAAWAADAHLRMALDRFDLDGDGSIGGEELTPEAQRALDEFANDTGRALVIVTGIPLTAIWSGLCLGLLFSAQWLLSKATGSASASSVPDNSVPRPESDNPYQPPQVSSLRQLVSPSSGAKQADPT